MHLWIKKKKKSKKNKQKKLTKEKKKLALESEQSTSKRLSLHCQVQVAEKKWGTLRAKMKKNLHIQFIYNTVFQLNCCGLCRSSTRSPMQIHFLKSTVTSCFNPLLIVVVRMLMCVYVHLQWPCKYEGQHNEIWKICTFHIHVQRINLHIAVRIVHLLMIYSIHTKKCTTYMFICVYVSPYLQYSRFKCILISRYILNKDVFFFFPSWKLDAFCTFTWLNLQRCDRF